MNAEHLKRKAQEIEERAIEVEYEQMLRISSQGGDGQSGAAAVDRDRIEQKYRGTIFPHFEPFTHMPHPGSYDGPIQDLGAAMCELSQGDMHDPINGRIFKSNDKLSRANAASGKLEAWTGEAADQFTTKFLDPFRDISTNQFLVLSVMKGAIEADQKRWEGAHKDVDRLVNATLQGLDNVGPSGKSELSFVFAVASAVAAIGAIPFTGGASAGFAVVGAAGSVGSAGIAGEKAISTKGAGSADQVVRSMKDAIDDLNKEIQKAGGKIAKALKDIQDEVRQDENAFVSERPALAGMRGQGVTNDDGLGWAN